DQAARLGLKDQRGVFVRGVEPDGPAAIAGVKPDDVVVRLADQPIDDGAGLRNRTAALPVGGAVPLGIIRDRKPLTLTVTIGEWPILASLGLRLEDVQGEAARRFPGQPEQAVFIADVLPAGEARRAGLLPGMRIVKVGNTSVSTKADCQAAAAALDPSEGVSIEVQITDGRKAQVVLGAIRSRPAR
ncbi:MAG: PDZ domain-containing protein, partial [Isosphaeraceae bacterium]